ncbi:MAG TPA: SMP-30/gluconolactonase/LRE family protein [Sphingobium sp.]
MTPTLTIIADNLAFVESPRWRNGRLWFSDFFDHAVKSVSPSGDLRNELEIDDHPSGLGWKPDGTLLIVSMTKRNILSWSGEGRASLWADISETASFHCNDMVVDKAGGAYVGNYGFDLSAHLADRGAAAVLAEHPTATLTYVSPQGIPRIVADEMHFPNGSIILPDQNILIVAETLAARLTAFDIEDDGSLSNRRIWAETGPYIPDGIALDAEGCIWIADPIGNACVRIREGGEVIQRITTEQPCYACEIGGLDGRTLFLLTADAFDHRQPPPTRTARIWATSL